MLNEGAIQRFTNQITISKNMAAKIVGGTTRLERLVGKGEIRAEKTSEHQHGKWQCNLWDCLNHATIL